MLAQFSKWCCSVADCRTVLPRLDFDYWLAVALLPHMVSAINRQISMLLKASKTRGAGKCNAVVYDQQDHCCSPTIHIIAHACVHTALQYQRQHELKRPPSALPLCSMHVQQQEGRTGSGEAVSTCLKARARAMGLQPQYYSK